MMKLSTWVNWLKTTKAELTEPFDVYCVPTLPIDEVVGPSEAEFGRDCPEHIRVEGSIFVHYPQWFERTFDGSVINDTLILRQKQ